MTKECGQLPGTELAYFLLGLGIAMGVLVPPLVRLKLRHRREEKPP